jgi:hypothetical protein
MKLLVDFLGWIPVLGISIKLAYVGNLAKEAIQKKMNSQENIDHKSEVGAEYFQEMATDFYDENLKSYVDELGLPEFATEKAKEKSIAMFAEKLQEKYSRRVSG